MDPWLPPEETLENKIKSDGDRFSTIFVCSNFPSEIFTILLYNIRNEKSAKKSKTRGTLQGRQLL